MKNAPWSCSLSMLLPNAVALCCIIKCSLGSSNQVRWGTAKQFGKEMYKHLSHRQIILCKANIVKWLVIVSTWCPMRCDFQLQLLGVAQMALPASSVAGCLYERGLYSTEWKEKTMLFSWQNETESLNISSRYIGHKVFTLVVKITRITQLFCSDFI